MNPRRVMTQRDAAELFDRAVQERALAVLTLQDADTWKTFKSRFLERDPRGQFFVLDYHAVNGEDLPGVTPGQFVGVSFRQRNHKLLFATVVQARGHYVLSDQTHVPAIRYRWPDTVTELQRRAYFRTPVPEDLKLCVTAWAGGLRARLGVQAGTVPAVAGELADLSCGGALVRFGDHVEPGWRNDETLGVELQLPDGRPPISLEARCRREGSDTQGSAIALQFIGLELNVDGSVVLQRIANAVQRLHRLGASPTRRGKEC